MVNLYRKTPLPRPNPDPCCGNGFRFRLSSPFEEAVRQSEGCRCWSNAVGDLLLWNGAWCVHAWLWLETLCKRDKCWSITCRSGFATGLCWLQATSFAPQDVDGSAANTISPTTSGPAPITPDRKPSAGGGNTSDAQALAMLIQDQLDAINNEIKLIQVEEEFNWFRVKYHRATRMLKTLENSRTFRRPVAQRCSW